MLHIFDYHSANCHRTAEYSDSPTQTKPAVHVCSATKVLSIQIVKYSNTQINFLCRALNTLVALHRVPTRKNIDLGTGVPKALGTEYFGIRTPRPGHV